MELISIIVPIYKVEPYLDRCVQSIVDQTYTNLQIILVDDGSPDGCPQMCDEWAKKDSRICVIHKPNGGLSDARNAGMAVAKGEYIAFVDSDDWIAPKYIDHLYRAARSCGALLSACDVRRINEGEQCMVPDNDECLPIEYSALEALSPKGWERVRAVAWNKLYHRSLLEGEEYPVGRHHEDEFFTYRIVYKAQRIVFIEEELYFYLQRQGSIMQEVSIKRLDALDAYMERLQFFREHYPELYVQEKEGLCVSLVGFYRAALEAKTTDFTAIEEKICACRKQICFSAKEWKNYSLKQLLYIWGTGMNLPLFSIAIQKCRGIVK